VREFSEMLYSMRESGEGDRPWILSGLRGVGKTVLLNQFGREAEELKIMFVKVEASSERSLATSLAKELHIALRRVTSLTERTHEAWALALATFRSFQLRVDPTGNYSFGFDVQPRGGAADSGDLAVDLAELLHSIGESAREANTALLVGVDELQEAAAADLKSLNTALHSLGQSSWPVPVLFVGAGLPSLPTVLADATSYAERLFDYRQLGLLDESATIDALVNPARAQSVEWDVLALQKTVEATGGYPYFIQACGKHVWTVRAQNNISLDDAVTGVERAREEVDQGLYQSRWDRVTPAQRAFMTAMAQDADSFSLIGDLVERLRKARTSDLSVVRRELIRSGHIYAPDRGFVAFTVPGMADFIHRHRE